MCDLALLLLTACSGTIGDQDPFEKGETDSGDTDTDTDTDSDTDTDTDGDTDADTDADGDTDTDPVPCAGGAGFVAVSTTVPLPAAPVAGDLPWSTPERSSYDQACTDGGSDADWYRDTFDLTGDGRPDLVIFKDTCTDPAVGTDQWTLHENTGAAFAAGRAWSLPAAAVDWTNPWYQATQSSYGNTCADGSHTGAADWSYQLTDLTGDGAPDLVVTEDTCGDATAGVDHWRVYVNDGAGFAEPPLTWTLPPAPVDWSDPWYTPEIDVTGSTCADGTQAGQVAWAHTLLDLTGDGAPDLVVTRDTCTDAEVGRGRWDVYPNTGVGFDATPLPWALPPADVDDAAPWARVVNQIDAATCADGTQAGAARRAYTTRDLTGDGWPDLVRTVDTCDDPAVGRSLWAVHPGRATGFDAVGVAWGLPTASVAGETPWDRVDVDEATATCSDGSGAGMARRVVTTTDMTGDGRPDLLVSVDTCAADAPGADHWRLHPNLGDGFDPVGVGWTLPPAPVREPLPWPTPTGAWDGASCTDGTQPYAATLRWWTTDLDGDALPDLVLTEDSCGDPAIGQTTWALHTGVCAG